MNVQTEEMNPEDTEFSATHADVGIQADEAPPIRVTAKVQVKPKTKSKG